MHQYFVCHEDGSLQQVEGATMDGVTVVRSPFDAPQSESPGRHSVFTETAKGLRDVLARIGLRILNDAEGYADEDVDPSIRAEAPLDTALIGKAVIHCLRTVLLRARPA